MTGASTQREPPSVLYHYTTPTGALGIIESGVARASMIHYMNDSREFKYALELAREIIDETPNLTEHARRLIAKEFLDAVSNVAVFIFSVTEHDDQLSQWRAYSGAGGGYALGFHRDLLSTIAREDQGQLIPCEYERDRQLELLRPLLVDMIRDADSLPDGARGLDLYGGHADRFTMAAAAIKHHSFKEEAEWRLVFGPAVSPDQTEACVRGSMLVPYYKCSLRRGSRYPFAEVVVGPSPSAHLAGRSLRYITSSKLKWPVKVRYSESSLRSF